MNDQPATIRLCPQTEAAIDALINANWDVSRLDDDHRPRAERLMQLLGASCSEDLSQHFPTADHVAAAILGQESREAVLTDEAADALDLWSQSGYTVSSVPRSLRPQASAHESLSRLVEQAVLGSDVEASEALVDDTIARVLNLDEAAQPREFTTRLKFRITDLASIAAVLLVAVSLAMPLLSMMRYESRRSANSSNFAASAVAFGSYASDHDGALPIYTPSGELGSQAHRPSPRWWLVGEDPAQSNSANLYTLTRTGYAPLRVLASPGNIYAVFEPTSDDAVDWSTFEEVSYSFRVPHRDEAPYSWAKRGMIIMTDRSPVTLKAYQRLPIDPFENSPNHQGRGQHALHGDGSVEWLDSPWLDRRDHVFLPNFVERMINPGVRESGMQPILGRERPGSLVDAFVGP